MPTHHYYLAYSHSRGFGSVAIPSTEPLNTYEAIHEIAEMIGQKFRVSDVIIISFQLLRVEQ